MGGKIEKDILLDTYPFRIYLPPLGIYIHRFWAQIIRLTYKISFFPCMRHKFYCINSLLCDGAAQLFQAHLPEFRLSGAKCSISFAPKCWIILGERCINFNLQRRRDWRGGGQEGWRRSGGGEEGWRRSGWGDRANEDVMEGKKVDDDVVERKRADGDLVERKSLTEI